MAALEELGRTFKRVLLDARSRISRAESRWASKAQSFCFVLMVGLNDQDKALFFILNAFSVLAALEGFGRAFKRVQFLANNADKGYQCVQVLLVLLLYCG